MLGKREETVPSNRERIDQQNTDQENHGRHKDGHNFHHCSLTEKDATSGIVLKHCHRDSPPGEGGVKRSRQEPGCKKVPDFGRLIPSLFRCKDAGDASKVNTTESEC
jgi:hypothetical protein